MAQHGPAAPGYGAVIDLDAQGTILSWDAGAELLFGFPAGEAIGTRVDQLLPTLGAVTEGFPVQRAIDSGQSTATVLCSRKDGSTIRIDIACERMASAGESSRVRASCVDTTRQKVEDDAGLIESRFGAVLEATPDGIVLANETGHIVFANTHAKDMFGYRTEALLGQPLEVLLPREVVAGHRRHRTGYFTNPRNRPMGAGLELHGRRSDGTEFPIEISLSPLRADGVTFAISAVRDITDRKRFEETLRVKNLELEQANRAKDAFLASMSHELRTPLNAIIGFTGMLLMKLPGPLTDDQAKHLRTVQSSAKHLLALINDLLDVARISADRFELHPEPVDYRQVVDEVAGSLRLAAERKGLAFSVDVPALDTTFVTDRRALYQILLNLVGNAVKFTERGSVGMRLYTGTFAGQPKVLVAVTDTGPGIAREDHPQLFQAFSRLGGTQRAATEGTGLGLHLSARLAGVLDGEITLESQRGAGSTFTLSLPARSPT